MTMPRALAVYCGSRPGNDTRFRRAAVRLGQAMAANDVTLVYGGGSVGLMGAIADAVLQGGGRAIGVIPHFLQEREVDHPGLTENHVVETMHERKMRMFDLADGYVVLPGGIGTLEELFEVMSWRVLGLHSKPIVVVDDGGYWSPMRAMITHLIDAGFAARRHARLLTFVESVEAVLPAFTALPASPQASDIGHI